MEEDDLRTLVERARGGDPSAVDAIVRRVGGRIRAGIRRRLGPELRRRLETEDLFQSAMLQSLADLDGLEYRGEAAFLGWLETIATRQVAMAVRKNRAARRDVRREVRFTRAGPLPSAWTSPTQAAVRGERRTSVREALEKLPPEEREIVRLHAYEGLSFREVAERLDLSGKVSAHRRFRMAMKKMVALLDPGEDP